jgi:hypothetical protein
VLTQSLSAVTAACLMIRRDVWEEVQGLDETLAIAYNDVDFFFIGTVTNMPDVWRYNRNFHNLSYHDFVSYCDI